METYEEILKKITGQLILAGIAGEDAVCDAWFLFEEAFHMRRAEYFLKKNDPCRDPSGITRLEILTRERAKRIPVQYLLGNQEFMGLSFFVNSSVLIPRSDTEILAERVLEDQKKGLIPKDARLLDLCTGSGCILLSLMKLGDFALGIGTDLSQEALDVAEKNAANLGLSFRNETDASPSEADGFSKNVFEELTKSQGCGIVWFLQGDLWEALRSVPEKALYKIGEDGKRVPEGFDVITANPPYIAEAERSDLMPEVVLYEPEMALFAEHDGLVFYERIAREAPKWLKAGGRLYLEIGCTQGEAVKELLLSSGAFEEDSLRVLPDLAGLDRVVTACRKQLG